MRTWPRFSAVVRAVDVWFGLRWDSATPKTANEAVDRATAYLENESVRRKALEGKNAEDAFSALWAIAYDDVALSIAPAEKLLKHPRPEMRYVATYHLWQIDPRLWQFPDWTPGPSATMTCTWRSAAINGLGAIRRDPGDEDSDTPAQKQELQQSLAPVYKTTRGTLSQAPRETADAQTARLAVDGVET